MREAEAPPGGIEHQQQLDQVVLHRVGKRLDQEYVLLAAVRLQLHLDAVIGEALDLGGEQRHAELGTDLRGELGVGAPAENGNLAHGEACLGDVWVGGRQLMAKPACGGKAGSVDLAASQRLMQLARVGFDQPIEADADEPAGIGQHPGRAAGEQLGLAALLYIGPAQHAGIGALAEEGDDARRNSHHLGLQLGAGDAKLGGRHFGGCSGGPQHHGAVPAR